MTIKEKLESVGIETDEMDQVDNWGGWSVESVMGKDVAELADAYATIMQAMYGDQPHAVQNLREAVEEQVLIYALG
jgi:hypothetical protein